jgi:hypothetical protein
LCGIAASAVVWKQLLLLKKSREVSGISFQSITRVNVKTTISFCWYYLGFFTQFANYSIKALTGSIPLVP